LNVLWKEDTPPGGRGEVCEQEQQRKKLFEFWIIKHSREEKSIQKNPSERKEKLVSIASLF
jgi:hypothetical protein